MRYLILLLLCGCATLTEGEREERKFQRDYRYAMELERYLERYSACQRAGRIWVTQSYAVKHKKPSLNDMRMAMCVERITVAP